MILWTVDVMTPAMMTGRGRASNPIMIVLVLMLGMIMMMTGFVVMMMYLYIIGRFCLSVTFLLIPALLR